MTTIPGKPIWFEHVSPDAKKAQAFYGEVLGWRTKAFPMPGGSYDMIFNGDASDPSTMIGGYGAPRGGAACWATVVSVADVDRACARAVEHGGSIVEGPADLPTVGRWARIADPQGAAISILHRDAGDPPDRLTPPGGFVWIELHTTDVPAALRFYDHVLGYTHEALPGGDYTVLHSGGAGRGGVSAHTGGAPPHWLPYVHAPDPDATCARARKAGGTVVMAPTDVPMAGRIAVIVDPTGASLALLRPDPSAH
jgi:predicted enzyme related to lactoylglutathione lyase